MIMPYIEEQQTSADMISEFRGYNHNPVINDNEFYDMENMTTDATPSIETRPKRSKLTITDNGDPIDVLAVTGKEKIMVAYSKEGSNSMTATSRVSANQSFDPDLWELIGTDYYLKLDVNNDYRTDWLKEQLKEVYSGDNNVWLYGEEGKKAHPITMNDNVERKIEGRFDVHAWLCQPFYLFDKVGDLERINGLEWLYPSGDGWGSYGKNCYHGAIPCPSNCDYIGIYYPVQRENENLTTGLLGTPSYIRTNCRVYTDGSMYFRDKSFENARVFFGDDSFSDSTLPKTYQVKMQGGYFAPGGIDEPNIYYYAYKLVIYDPDHDCPLRNWGYGATTSAETFNQAAYNASRKMYVCYGSFNYPEECNIEDTNWVDTDDLVSVVPVTAEVELLRKIQPNETVRIGDEEVMVASVNVTESKITIRANHNEIPQGTVIGYPTESVWLAQLDLSTNKLKNQTIVCDLNRKYDHDGNEIKQKHQIVEMGANIVLFPEKYVINTADTEKIWNYILLTSETEPGDWSDYSSFFELVDGEYVQLTAPETYVQNTYYWRELVRERYTKVEEIQPKGFYSNAGLSFYESDLRSMVGKGSYNIWYMCNSDPSTSITIDDGDMWIDTSTSPNTIKRRIGNMWVEREIYVQISSNPNEAPLLREGDAVSISFLGKSTASDIEHFIYGNQLQDFTIRTTYQYGYNLYYSFITTSDLKFDFPSTDSIQKISFSSPSHSEFTSEFTEATGISSVTNSSKNFITRYVPNCDFVIESNNRLWGCRYGENKKGDFVNEIFATKLGDPTSWTYLRNTAEDSYYVSLGDDGAFTGAVNFNGTPVFFRKDKIHRITGFYPSQYQLQTISADGVDTGSENSISVLNGVVYYNSPHGIMAWSGGVPQNISKVFGNKLYTNGASGHIKNKMYFSMMDGETPVAFCLDTDKGLWCKENNDRWDYLFDWEGKLYGMRGNEMTIFEGEGGELEDDLTFMLQSGDIGYGSVYKKYLNKMTMRLKLPLGSRASIEIQYDSDGTWRHITELRPTKVAYTYAVPIIPHRCDHFSIRIRGKGKITLMQLSKHWKEGTDYA